MTLFSDIGEFGFIDKIRNGCEVCPESIVKGIGDDAAVFRTDHGKVTLLTTDLLVERIHFIKEGMSGFELGYKSLAVNLSDIAAMGGTAEHAFVSIAVPENCKIEWIEQIYDGMKALGKKYAVNILGGDTTGSKKDLVINVAVVGSAQEKEILYRSGARPGDILCTTGYIGDSRAGLDLILKQALIDEPHMSVLKKAHVLPEPHLKEGRFLAETGKVHSAIDISDGLSSDLKHLTDESGVGAVIFSDKLPISKDLKFFCESCDIDPVQFALAGGEDYVLLCAVDRNACEKIARGFKEKFGKTLFRLGRVTETEKIERVGTDGSRYPMDPSGWDHFKK